MIKTIYPVINTGKERGGASACVKTMTIHVSKGFLELDQNVQNAILLHEEGHLVNGHYNTPSDTFLHRLKQESIADLYAYEMGADIIGALRYILDVRTNTPKPEEDMTLMRYEGLLSLAALVA